MDTIKSLSQLENYIDRYDAFIFDLDDTLFSEKEYVKSGYHKIAVAYPQIDDLEGKLWRAFLAGEPAIDKVLTDEALTNMEATKAEWLSIYRNQMPDIHLYSEASEILDHIRSKDKYIGIITDGRPEGQRAKIEALKLADRVNYIMVTDELGGPEFRKPCEKAFIMMQEAAGMAYSQMVYIGDNTKKDFIAPEKLGMGAIWLDNEDGIYSH